LNILIEGHTDDIGTKDHNLLLSQKRAEEVSKYLQQKGIESSRLKSIGYGETKAAITNDSEKTRAANRRVEFKIYY